MSGCFLSSFVWSTAASDARMQYAYAAMGSRSSPLSIPNTAGEQIRSSFVVRRTTRVSNNGGVVHNFSSHRRICQYFSLSVTASLPGAASGKDEKRVGNVDSSTIFEFVLAMSIRRSKASSLILSANSEVRVTQDYGLTMKPQSSPQTLVRLRLLYGRYKSVLLQRRRLVSQ